MKEVELTDGDVILVLTTHEGDGTFIHLRDLQGAVVASFPVNPAILRSVASGYSYQIASTEGSLMASLEDGKVGFRFDDRNGQGRRWKLERQVFEQSLAEFND